MVTSAFLEGALTLEVLIRGILALICDVEEKHHGFDFKKTWDREAANPDFDMPMQQKAKSKLMALVLGVPFMNGIGREAWYYYWGSLLHSLNVHLGFSSDEMARPVLE